MRKRLFQIAFLFLVVSLFQGGAGLLYSATDPLKGLDAYILKAMKDWELPGLAIAIVKDDRVVLVKDTG